MYLALFWGSHPVSPSSRCWILDFSLLSFSILALNQSFTLLVILFFTVVFSPFMSLSSISSCSFAFFVSSAHFDVVVLFVMSFFILWLLPLVSLCSMSTLFFSLIASGSSNPVSMYSASLGVLCGTISILLMMLSMILLIFSCSVFPGFQISLLYAMVDSMQLCVSSHIVCISMLLKFLFPAMANRVWYAFSTFPLRALMWSSRLFLLFCMYPRYLYLSVYFRFMSPRVNSGLFLLRPIFITLLFSSPNSMWYFPAIVFVISSIS